MRVAVLASLVGLAGCNWGFSRMNDQPRCEPGDRTEWLPDQRCDQPPPPNVVAWQSAQPPPPPPPPSRALIARGGDRFDKFCAPCHGLVGDAESPVARDMHLRKPRSLHEPKVVNAPDSDLFLTISAGYGMMPAYALQLPEADRWAVIQYVRVLQRSQAVQVARLPVSRQKELASWP
jgi:mono/diheme cytochrome c family protein